MDNMIEKIYKIVYVGAFAANGVALIIYLLGAGQSVSITFPLIVFGIATFIMFLMGRLVEERFDTTLQMYLIVISVSYLVVAFIPPYKFLLTFWEVLTALSIFAIAFFLDEFFESE